MRPTAGGKGSYDVIVPKFQKLVAGRGTKDYYARGTFTRENLDFAQDVMHLASLGFRHVSVEPASGCLLYTSARPLRAGGPFGGLPFGRGWTGTGSLATLTDVGRYLYLAKTWVYPIMFAGGCQYETEKWEIR